MVVQAPAPARLIEGGLPTEATVAQVSVSKYADHLRLYRRAQIYARQGLSLDRSTLAERTRCIRRGYLLDPSRVIAAAIPSGSRPWWPICCHRPPLPSTCVPRWSYRPLKPWRSR